MPTVTIHCSPKYYPYPDSGNNSMAKVALELAEAMPPIVSDAINSVDRRDTSAGGNAIERNQVFVPFAHLDPQSVNAPEVLVVVNPPEVDATFEERQIRRTRIEWLIRVGIELALSNLEKFPDVILPHWEVEVICVESTGSGSVGTGKEIYNWGRYVPDRRS